MGPQVYKYIYERKLENAAEMPICSLIAGGELEGTDN